MLCTIVILTGTARRAGRDWKTGGETQQLWYFAVLRGWKLGGRKCPPPFLHTELRWSSGGAPHPRQRPSGDRATARPDSWPVPPSCVDNGCKGTGHEFIGQDTPHHPRRQRRRRAQGGGDETGGRDAQGEEGPVDGLPGRARLGQEGQLQHHDLERPLPHFYTLPNGYFGFRFLINWLIILNKC